MDPIDVYKLSDIEIRNRKSKMYKRNSIIEITRMMKLRLMYSFRSIDSQSNKSRGNQILYKLLYDEYASINITNLLLWNIII